jgi:hypothetical protein
LSLDFVDPARLATLAAASSPRASTAATAAPAMDTIMPAPRPLFAARAEVSDLATLTAEEWSLVATFPSAATAIQMVAARQAAEWQATPLAARAQGLSRPLVAVGNDEAAWTTTGEAQRGRAARLPAGVLARELATATSPLTPATTTPTMLATLAPATAADPRVSAAAQRGGAPMELVAPRPAPVTPTTGLEPTVAALDSARLPGGRAPRGGFLWPKLAELAPTAHQLLAPPAVTIAEAAKDVAPGSPLWGALPSLVSIAPALAAGFELASPSPSGSPATTATAATPTPARGATTARDLVAPLARATDALAPTAGPATGANLPVTTAATTRSEPGRAAPSLTLLSTAPGSPEAARLAAAVSLAGGRAPTSAPPDSSSATAPALTGAAARALELARPFLRLAETGAEPARSSGSPRFFEAPPPVVAATPANLAASSMVEAMRSPPAATSGDDRMTLSDLTLISMASATMQVAASPAGGAPAGSGGAAGPAASGGGGEAGPGPGKAGNPVQEVEELARAAFDELQRLILVARERSGDSWES